MIWRADLARLPDKRHARGLRHALVTVLVYIVLAKLAGQDRVYGIAQWAKHRQAPLAEAFGLSRVSAPSVNTYRRVLATAIDIEDFERVVRDFFGALPRAGHRVVIAVDGKPCAERFRRGRRTDGTCWRRICQLKAGCCIKSKSPVKRMKSVLRRAS